MNTDTMTVARSRNAFLSSAPPVMDITTNPTENVVTIMYTTP
jgi:hypothetical protein